MSIVKVAQEAGLSKSTVSLVINGSSQVSEETAARVHKAMKRLNYTPRPVHRRGGRRKQVTSRLKLALVSTPEASLHFDSEMSDFYSKMLRGIEQECTSRGDTLVMASCATSDEYQKLFEQKYDCLLVFGDMPNSKDIEHQLPLVSVFGPHRRQLFGDWVSYDDEAVGEIAAAYLIDCGCNHIAARSE